MVELCELKLLSNCANGGGMEEWPPDIDQHVAQLDFAQSTSSMGRSSLFASITLDPSVINSTDSLDMEQLRIRCCETNKNDYKLTFEDSGQWTTSGFGGSTTNSPPTPTGRMRSKRSSRQRLYELQGRGPLSKGNLIGLRLLEELNNEEQSDDEEEDEEEKRIDNLLNNSPANGQTAMTTWGRIRSTSSTEGPPFEEKTYSLPELNSGMKMRSGCLPSAPRRPVSDIGLPLPPPPPTSGSSRPLSLVANFVEQQAQRLPDYSERYLGNGRYVDVNENELGFVPESTSALQRADRWRNHHDPGPSTSSAGSRPRTFADLVPSLTAPDLKFLSLAHKVPGFCRSSVSLDDMLRQAAERGCVAVAAECVGEEPMLLEPSSSLCSNTALGVMDKNQGGPDSGMGSSSTPSSAGGPMHIEDWTSLSMLLPRHVVDACSFFKQNSSLLSGSSASGSNNIERKIPRASSAYATTPLSHLSSQRRPSDCCFCDPHSPNTTTSQILPKSSKPKGAGRFSGLPARLKTLHAQELAIIGLPLYEAKRDLVERVVEGVAEIRRGASAIVLWSAMERLLTDGLLDGFSAWEVVVEITSPTATGPMGPIHQLVKDIEASEKPGNSRLQHFFKELLEQHSLDGWLTYAVLKERVLSRLYADTAFLLRANSSYRSLFWRLVESLELLSVLSQCQSRIPKKQQIHTGQWGSASRMPGDSRVPKSSSVPSKLLRPATLALHSSSSNCSNNSFKSCSSRIPVLLGSYRSTPSSPASRPRPRPDNDTTSLHVVATVREAIAPKLNGRRKRWLPLEAGEKVRILSIRGPWSRCSRLNSRHGLITNGAVPTHALDLC